MKIAYIILAHKNPAQVIRLVNALNERTTTEFFIHVEKIAGSEIYRYIVDNLKTYPNVHFLKRYKCPHLGFGTVEATVEGIKNALQSKELFDYVINLSGQDYPIKTNDQIKDKLEKNLNCSYLWYFALPFEGVHPSKGQICQRMNRIEYWHLRRHNFYIRVPLNKSRYRKIFSFKHSPLWMAFNLFFPKKRKFIGNFTAFSGGQWNCLSRKHAKYVLEFIDENPKFYSYFKYVNVPDEMFFQTLLLNSPYKNEIINDDLRLLHFKDNNSHSVTYTTEDFTNITASEQLFARKFDSVQDERILDLIDDHLLKGKAKDQVGN